MSPRLRGLAPGPLRGVSLVVLLALAVCAVGGAVIGLMVLADHLIGG